MSIQPLPFLILGHNPVQSRAHVCAHILVPVLVQRQRAGSVLDEEVEQPGFVVFNLRELFQDCVGYEVGAPAARGEGELLLEPGTQLLAGARRVEGRLGGLLYQDIVGGAVQIFGLEQSTELRGAAAGK